jgi:hypothetical protein
MPDPIRKRGDRGPSSLKQSHVARVVKGVAAAGIANARFEVDPHSGKITVFVGQPTEGDTPENYEICAAVAAVCVA